MYFNPFINRATLSKKKSVNLTDFHRYFHSTHLHFKSTHVRIYLHLEKFIKHFFRQPNPALSARAYIFQTNTMLLPTTHNTLCTICTRNAGIYFEVPPKGCSYLFSNTYVLILRIIPIWRISIGPCSHFAFSFLFSHETFAIFDICSSLV